MCNLYDNVLCCDCVWCFNITGQGEKEIKSKTTDIPDYIDRLDSVGNPSS